MTLEEAIRQRLDEASKEVQTQQVVAPVVAPVVVEEKTVELTEAMLDAMTQEEFDAIDEEQLDELSKKTLGSYIKVAAKSRTTLSDKRKKLSDTDQKLGSLDIDDPKDSDSVYDIRKNLRSKELKLSDKDDNRRVGINSAVKRLTKEETSEQLDALLESVELTEEFKEQAAVIFAAAVQDKVLQIEEELQTQFDSELAVAKTELDKDIDGFLSEAIQQWKAENEVAIKSNFNTQVAESFMDGLLNLIAEHNIELPEVKHDALNAAMDEVSELTEQVKSKDIELQTLAEQVSSLKAEKILESFNKKMTETEFDRFSQLAESVQFKDQVQYEKQLGIILENFGQTKAAPKVEQTKMITEVTGVTEIVSETTGDVLAYASFIAKK